MFFRLPIVHNIGSLKRSNPMKIISKFKNLYSLFS